MSAILAFNGLFFVIYLLSWLMDQVGFPWFIHLAGFVFFFLPGYNLALAFEQTLSKPMGRAKISVWSILISLILIPPLIYFLTLRQGFLGDSHITLAIFFILWLLTLAISLFIFLLRKQPITLLKLPSFSHYRFLWLATSAILTSLAIHFFIYPFIPEYDGYNYLIAIEKTIASGKFTGFDNRFSFFAFVWTLSFLSKISIYWLFKIALPILSIAILIPFYKLGENLFKNRRLELIAALSLFFFSVFFLEILVVRPQMIFLVSFPLILYLLLDIEKASAREKYFGYLFLFVLIVAGNLLHQAFFFIFPILLICAVFDFHRDIRRRPIVSIIAISIFMSLIITAVFAMGMQYLMKSYFIMIKQYLSPFKWQWWFLDNYTDTFGQKVGWPGYTFIFYYGYNLGLFLPIMIFLAAIRRIRLKINWTQFFPVIVAFAMFFFLAEILPRLGLPYLPSRMWIFAIVPLSFLIPYLIQELEKKFPPKIFFFGMLFLAFVSIAISWYLTNNKQGWISHEEYKAAQFVKNNTPQDSLIISQGGNGVMIDYFAQRKLLYPTALFFTGNLISTDFLILDQAKDISELEQKDEYGVIINHHKIIEMLYNGTYGLDPVSDDSVRPPVYVVYSQNKFSGLHGNRAWWKEMNFSNADLAKFNNRPDLFEKIYDRSGILIWKYLK